MLERAQRTLKREVHYSGVGIHFGKSATLTLEPAEENTGIVFSRSDTAGEYIPALLSHVCSTGRSTTLSSGILLLQLLNISWLPCGLVILIM